MVNINIELPQALHKQLKLASVMSDQTLKEYIINVLAEATKDG